MAIDICTKALNSAGETLDTSLMAGYDLTSHCIRLTLPAVIGEIQLHGIHNQHHLYILSSFTNPFGRKQLDICTPAALCGMNIFI